MKKAKQEKKAQSETPEVIWEKDFLSLKRSSLFRKFEQILTCIYKYNGKLKVLSNFSNSFNISYDFQIDEDILIYADTNNLITIKSDTMFFTDKGKFFAKRYSQVKNGIFYTNAAEL